VFANEGDKRPVGRPVVTQVGEAMAEDPGRIMIEGQRLGLIQEVRLDGAVLPVVRNTGYALWIEPPPQDPGFGTLELFYPRGVLTETLEFAPTLMANHQPRRIELTLNGGPAGGGWYALSYSFRLNQTPVARAGIYYLDWLDMTSPYSGLVASGFFHSTAREVFQFERIGLVNRPIFFQSLCTTADGDMCYSNAVTVLPAGHVGTSDVPGVK
jgi:hypothetical protein